MSFWQGFAMAFDLRFIDWGFVGFILGGMLFSLAGAAVIGVAGFVALMLVERIIER